MERFSIKERLEQKLKGKPVKEKKSYKIPVRSKKRIKEQRIYVKIVQEKAKESNECELQVPGVCIGIMGGLDHAKKRGKYFLDRRYLKRACDPCNNWKERFPKEAIALGISLSKFTKD